MGVQRQGVHPHQHGGRAVGGDLVIVKCADGQTRVCRIRGKLKRRMWIRENDIVLVSPWDFDNRKADILWRYIRAHADWLEANNYLKNI
ncbi:MAG: translation initiation factor 1A [Thaumarchaeota archaeon]|nr:MAG: translation initiation factor 1A [Nitrososphaerota archaeon]